MGKRTERTIGTDDGRMYVVSRYERRTAKDDAESESNSDFEDLEEIEVESNVKDENLEEEVAHQDAEKDVEVEEPKEELFAEQKTERDPEQSAGARSEACSMIVRQRWPLPRPRCRPGIYVIGRTRD